MTLAVRLRLAAQAEYDEAADWYESRQRGLGPRFVAAIRHVLSEVADQPQRWPEVMPGIREAPVPCWPYAIYYQTQPDHVLILAVFHQARDPAVWQARV